MNTIVEKITEQLQNAFAECGYDRKYAKVSLSNRPDLCEYQCNGAMAAAKEYKKAPFMIADEVVAKLDKNPLFDRIESVKPGFINIILSGKAVADYVNEMTQAIQFGQYGNNALLIETEFGDERMINGYFILMPEEESYAKILSSLGIQL